MRITSPLFTDQRPIVPWERVVAFFLFSYVVLASENAQASTMLTLGDIICNLTGQASVFSYILNAVSYVIGCFLGARGLYMLRDHFFNPNQSKIPASVAHLVVSGFFMSLPSFAGVIQNTLFSGISGSGNVGCYPGTVSGGSASDPTDLSTMFQNFADNIYEPMLYLLAVLGWAIGLYLIAKGLMKCARIGTDPKAAASHGIIINFVVGAVLISMSEMLPTVIASVFGVGDADSASSFASLINWSTVTNDTDTTAANKTVQSCLMFVQVIGAIAFLRGWLMLKTAVEGSGGPNQTVPQGLTHIIGGAMAINIGTMVQIIDHTIGTGLTGG